MDSIAQVNRCVCRRRSFKQLKKISDEQGIERVEKLIEQGLCGDGCGLCVPYVKLMFKTGRTTFKPSDIHEEGDPV